MLFSVEGVSRFSKIVLGSGSPRRKEILMNKGGLTDLVIETSTYEEESKGLFDPSKVYNYITGIAHGKVQQVALLDKWNADLDTYHKTLFIGADTLVLQNGKIFEKPTSKEDATSMLKCFRDNVHHQVCSGVVLLLPKPNNTSQQQQFFSHSFHETTDVKFAAVTDAVIERYVDTGESMDKAGGYGIQGLGAQLVESINGDYYNVMGFPMRRFCNELNLFIESLDRGDPNA